MNTKFLLVIVLVLNIGMLIYGTQICGSFDPNSQSTQVIDYFYDYSFLKTAYLQCKSTHQAALLPTGQQVNLASSVNGTSTTFGNAVNASTTVSAGIVGAYTPGGSSFIDLIKLVINIPALVFGLPVMAMLMSLGVNPIFVWTVIPLLEFLLLIGAVEFLRGGSF